MPDVFGVEHPYRRIEIATTKKPPQQNLCFILPPIKTDHSHSRTREFILPNNRYARHVWQCCVVFGHSASSHDRHPTEVDAWVSSVFTRGEHPRSGFCGVCVLFSSSRRGVLYSGFALDRALAMIEW